MERVGSPLVEGGAEAAQSIPKPLTSHSVAYKGFSNGDDIAGWVEI